MDNRKRKLGDGEVQERVRKYWKEMLAEKKKFREEMYHWCER